MRKITIKYTINDEGGAEGMSIREIEIDDDNLESESMMWYANPKSFMEALKEHGVG